MTDRTPADTLTAAADYLRLVAETNRAIGENRTIPVEMQGRTQASVARADMHPGVGAALADWLEHAATALRTHTHPEWQETVAGLPLAVARQLLGEAS